MLIGGEWVLPASGRTFTTTNPATGKLLAESAEDVERAVIAARSALEGPWGRFKPAERQRVLLRMADIVERNFEELCHRYP